MNIIKKTIKQWATHIDTQTLQHSKMSIKSQNKIEINKRQITRLNTNVHRDIPISPGSTLPHTRSMIPYTSVLSQVIYYTYKTNVQ